MALRKPKKTKISKPNTSELPRSLQRNYLLDIVEISSEAPNGLSDECLAALADVAYMDRAAIKKYYDLRRERHNNMTKTLPAFPQANYEGIEPEF